MSLLANSSKMKVALALVWVVAGSTFSFAIAKCAGAYNQGPGPVETCVDGIVWTQNCTVWCCPTKDGGSSQYSNCTGDPIPKLVDGHPVACDKSHSYPWTPSIICPPASP